METLKCLLCDKDMKEFITTFFKDKNGHQRYGSVCQCCYKELKKLRVEGK